MWGDPGGAAYADPDLAGKLAAQLVVAQCREQAEHGLGHPRAHGGQRVMLRGLGLGQAVEAACDLLDNPQDDELSQLRRSNADGMQVPRAKERPQAGSL